MYYGDGTTIKQISGINKIPHLTQAQYEALNVKPSVWVRTDAPDSYKRLGANQVEYDSSNTVKDMLDSEAITFTNVATGSLNYVNGFRIGKLVVINFAIGEISANTVLFTVPEKYRPSSNKAVSQFMNTTSSTMGTKTFTLVASNGNVFCDSNVYRGGVWFIYSL